MFKYFFAFLICLSHFSCQDASNQNNPLDVVLGSKNVKIKRVLDNLESYSVQIKFSQINRKNDSISFTDYSFQVDSTQYFYPASTVKFPIALLALAKLNRTKNMDRNTRFYVEGDTIETTVQKEIEKIFAVSDNEANNRLFEFLGQDYINHELQKILEGSIRISHRLSTADADEITTKPIVIYLNDSTTTILPSSINTSAQPLLLNQVQKGLGYYEGDSLMQGAFDFGLKNYYPVETQHEFLKKVIFSNQYAPHEKLNLTNDQLDFVHQAMRTLPKNLNYDPEIYYDGYGKFLMYGDTKEAIPDHVKIYNKVGIAYGTITDCAYIQDTQNDIEFLLTATILVNKNGIFNDNTYEYDSIGFPFLAELGREFYQYERNRKK